MRKSKPESNIDPTDRAAALHEEAMTLRERGDAKRAKAPCVRALALFEKHEGPDHPDVANVRIELGAILEALGDYDGARRELERANAILAKWPLRGEHALTLARMRVHALGQLGALAVTCGDYRAAEKAHKRALTLAKKKLPEEEAATSMNGLAIVYKYTAKFDEALKLYRGALAILERITKDPDADPAIATVQHNLGGLEHSRGRFSRGEPHARRSVEIRERAAGKDHPAVAADVAALAAILDGQGKHEEAERLYKRAIAIFEKKLGKEHFEVAFNIAQLAVLYQSSDRYAEADRHYAKAIPLLEKSLGKHHPTVALTLSNLASLRVEQGAKAKAKPLYRRALSIYEKTLGKKHPDTRDCAKALAALR
jgi:tetratricopeptide (TPR) repeat protein